MATPWYETFLLLITHLPQIGATVVAFLRNIFFPATIYLITVFASCFYHACMAVDVCPFNGTETSWRIVDWMFATSNTLATMSAIFAYLQERLFYNNKEDYASRRRYSRIKGSLDIVTLVTFSVLIIFVTLFMTSPMVFSGNTMAFGIIIMALLVAYVAICVLLVHDNLLHLHNVTWELMGAALVCYGIGLGAFLIDVPGAYPYTHSVWHFFVFTGNLLAILSVTLVDLRGEKTWRSLEHIHSHAWNTVMEWMSPKKH